MTDINEDDEFFDLVGTGNDPKLQFLDALKRCGKTNPIVVGDDITLTSAAGICENLEIGNVFGRTELFCVECGILCTIELDGVTESGEPEVETEMDEMDEFLGIVGDGDDW